MSVRRIDLVDPSRAEVEAVLPRGGDPDVLEELVLPACDLPLAPLDLAPVREYGDGVARCVTAICLAGIVLVSAASAAPSATTTVFRDTTGEEPSGPDITTVTVTSDGDRLAFGIAIPTSPVVTPDMRIRIWLDADDSLETGLTFETGPTGLDHFLIVDPTRFRPDQAVLYGPCAGNTCVPSRFVQFAYASGATFTLDASALGLNRVDRLRFSATVTVGIGFGPDGYDFTNARIDSAPDARGEGVQPMWRFASQPLLVRDVRAVPARPRAEQAFAVTMRVEHFDTGALLTRGDVTCTLRVGSELVPARRSRFVGRSATCLFGVPPDAKGRPYRATIAVAAQGAVVTRSLSGRIG